MVSALEVELDLKHLKTTLGMDILRGKTKRNGTHKRFMLQKLAYNLLRTLMWEAGTTYKIDPLRLSLQGTRQYLDNFIPQLAFASNQKRVQLYQVLLKIIAHELVPQRQGRCESRVRKRRPKAYPLMTKPVKSCAKIVLPKSAFR